MKKKNRSRGTFCEPLENRQLFASWTGLTNRPAAGIGTMMLLPNGTVMAQGAGVSNTWYSLKPDSTGSYVNGTWTQLASMSLQRLYFASCVLPDNRVFVLGGEYSGASGSSTWTNTGEMYNPNTNTWTSIANMPESQFGDVPSTVLPDGRIMVGSLTTANTYIYNPNTNVWTTGATKLNGDRSDEEAWVKLGDGSILSYNIFGTNPQAAQRYYPATNTWVASGTSPVQLETSSGKELGPGLRLPDGRVFYAGATNHNAIYTPPSDTVSPGSWVAAPDTPNSLGANDAPGAVLPNGHVLYAAGTTPSFASPTVIYDYDPTANTITAAPTTGGPTFSSMVAYNSRMLMLPTGQVLFTYGSNQLYVYNSDGSPSDSWRPTISNITNSAGTYTLTGTQLNGLSEGASYGDDAEMSTNYPIIRLTDANGVVSYARTFNWSSTGVATGTTPVTTQFVLPTGITAGAYKLAVIANGIASKESLVVFEGGSALPGGATLKLDPTNSANVAVYSGSSVFAKFPISSVTAAYVVGDSGNDVTEVDDDLNLLPVFVSGGGGSDQLVVKSNFANASTWLLQNNLVGEAGRLNLTYASDAGPISLTMSSGTDTLVVDSTSSTNPVTVLPTAGVDSILQSGGSLLTLSGSQTLNQLSVGGTINLPANGNSVIRASQLSVAGKLDLSNNTMILDYSGSSPLSSVKGHLASGRNGGTWNGSTGIISSSVVGVASSSLGYGEASTILGASGGTFAGQTVDGTAILIRFTKLGDANLNRTVDAADFVLLSNNFGASNSSWTQGNFNYDTTTDAADFVLLSNNFGATMSFPSTPPVSAPVVTPTKSSPPVATPPTKTPVKTVPIINPIAVIPPPISFV